MRGTQDLWAEQERKAGRQVWRGATPRGSGWRGQPWWGTGDRGIPEGAVSRLQLLHPSDSNDTACASVCVCVCVAHTPLGKRAPVKILSTETEHNHQDGKQMAWKHCRGLSRELIVPSKPGPASPETLGLAKWPGSAGVLRPRPFPRGWGSKCRHSPAPCSFSRYCHPCTASQ